MFAEDQEIIPYLEVRMSLQLGVVGLRPLCVVHFHRKVTGGGWELGGVLSGAAEEAGS